MLTRLLRRLAWKLVREEVGAAILAAEQRQLEVHKSAADRMQSIEALVATVHNGAVLRQRALVVNLVQILNEHGLSVAVVEPTTDIADSGFEIIPPNKMH